MIQEWIALIILSILSLGALALTFIGIGGTFAIVLGALLYNLITWSWTISMTIILWLFGLAVLGEILEWLISVITSKKKGTSHLGVAGMILGALFGGSLLSFVPIIGSLIGFVTGAIIGAYLGELANTKDAHKAWKAAKAALVSRGFVSLTKTTLAIIQIIIILRTIPLP